MKGGDQCLNVIHFLAFSLAAFLRHSVIRLNEVNSIDKHLHINIQFGELYALIRANLTFLDQQEPPHLRLLSVPEFLASLRRITETFKVAARRERLFVAHSYAQEFGQTLVIDPLFGSCLVYLPPLLRLNLERICGESGYIHSCGVNLFSQFAYNTRTEDLIEALPLNSQLGH